jgi:hypothetical protein
MPGGSQREQLSKHSRTSFAEPGCIPGRAPFSQDDAHSPRPDELAAAAGGSLTYSGPYAVVGDGVIARVMPAR